jgi:RNA polymerase sigma-70 factor, ECF subfamily
MAALSPRVRACPLSVVTALDDGRLMKQTESGSVKAFEELYDRYCDRAYRVAWWVCHNDEHAEEAVQEAFMSIWRGRTEYQSGRGTLAAWLLTLVRFRAIDVVRCSTKHADRRAGEHRLDAHCAPSDMADEAVAHEDAVRLHTLLGGLPPVQREVVVLAYYGQLTHTEIAAALGLPTGTVKGRMRLGLCKLQAAIEEDVS